MWSQVKHSIIFPFIFLIPPLNFFRIGRHSKSIDTTKKVCGRCRSRLVLLNSKDDPLPSGINAPSHQELKTPKTLTPFAKFVKENYGSVKKSQGTVKHGDVMKILSSKFSEMKTK